MNRKNLTAAVLAGLAGAAGIASTAQAVNVNPDGLGQVLIYPYYTVNGGNLTILSVVNTTDEAKAVKVRFLEGMNSKEVLDFNLYLSAFDVWAAAIVDDEGTPTLEITDRSCTVPDLVRDFGGWQPFLTAGYSKDGGPTSIARAREGHFEMIEMGVLTNETMKSAAAATHKDGEPAKCSQLVDAWTLGPDGKDGTDDDGYWLDVQSSEGSPAYGPTTDIDYPSGGLFGGAAVINVENGTMFGYDARALNGFASQDINESDITTLHAYPGDEQPSLNDGDIFTGRAFDQNGNPQDASFLTGVDAVSYVFMHDAVMNEYNVQSDLNASSEWVVTFPTKSYYVNVTPAKAPFLDTWSDHDADKVKDGACEPVLLNTVWDREEEDILTGTTGEDCPPVVSPGEVECGKPFVPFMICQETNVLRFGATEGRPDATEILGSANYTNVDPGSFGNGWARIDMMLYEEGNLGATDIFMRPPLNANTGNDSWGLPVTGFWVMGIENNFLGDGADVLANYGGLFNHKATRCFAGEACRPDEDITFD